MAGGTFTGQNKIRPGAYLNFVAVPKPKMTLGNRGIGIIPLSLPWGSTEELIKVYSTDMYDGKSLAKVGFTAFDKDGKLLNLMLSNCHTALVYRANANGERASVTIGDLLVKAKYPGTLGNAITVAIKKVDKEFDVSTYLKVVLKDTQRVSSIAELEDNAFVSFSDTKSSAEPEEEGEGTTVSVKQGILQDAAGEPLVGGTDGKSEPSTMLPTFLDLASLAQWQTMAVPLDDPAIGERVKSFIEDQRDKQGRYVQAVLPNFAEANYEGVISNFQAVTINGEQITAAEMSAWIAGATAGAGITESLTGRTVLGATNIINPLQHDEIENALKEGKFTLSYKQNGEIQCEQDINTLTQYPQERSEAFSKNRILRTLDEIGTTIKDMWERVYMGKVNNSETGRAAFRGDVINYLTNVQNIGAIQEFNGADDVVVERGESLSSVVATVAIMPVDSMEYLYLTVNVSS